MSRASSIGATVNWKVKKKSKITSVDFDSTGIQKNTQVPSNFTISRIRNLVWRVLKLPLKKGFKI
jgi:hypothetical protein